MADKVLIVDDDISICKLLEKVMHSNELDTEVAGSGKEALELLKHHTYDVILMDIMLGDMEGFDVIKELRASGIQTPVMIVSGRNEDYDSLYGLSIGADDYITKPFSPVVLQKKIAVLTKYITEKQKETVYEDGNLCINFSQMTATLDKVPLELSPLEYRILQYFIVNKKHILKRDQLLEHLWDFSENFVGDTSLNTAISRLRKKIEASGHRYIKTIYGTGYMWIGD